MRMRLPKRTWAHRSTTYSAQNKEKSGSRLNGMEGNSHPGIERRVTPPKMSLPGSMANTPGTGRGISSVMRTIADSMRDWVAEVKSDIMALSLVGTRERHGLAQFNSWYNRPVASPVMGSEEVRQTHFGTQTNSRSLRCRCRCRGGNDAVVAGEEIRGAVTASS